MDRASNEGSHGLDIVMNGVSLSSLQIYSLLELFTMDDYSSNNYSYITRHESRVYENVNVSLRDRIIV